MRVQRSIRLRSVTYVFYAQDLKRNDPVNLLAKTFKLDVSEGSSAQIKFGKSASWNLSDERREI